MFTTRSTGLLDFLAAALCLWAAAYHTPVGALARGVYARLTDTQAQVLPLLAYYSGGVYDAVETSEAEASAALPAPSALTPEAVLTAPVGSPLGRGVYGALLGAAPAVQQRARAYASTHGGAALFAGEPRAAAEAAAALVATLAPTVGGSDEAAVLALFAGDELARYAVGRARAEGRGASLEVLARQLPPGAGPALAATGQALTLATAFGLDWPVDKATRVSSPFGLRTHPTLGRAQLHTGVDLAVPEGTPVRVTFSGTVRRASEDGVNGKVLIVDHGRGVSTAYCHNSQLLVRAGQEVAAGEVIASSGNTGRSTGAHVHYQVELGGRPMDPFLFRGSTVGALALPPVPGPLPGPLPAAPRPSRALTEAFQRVGSVPEEGPLAPDGGEGAP